MLRSTLAASALAATAAAAAHPTLPSAWTAQVQEAKVGDVLESYLMVDRPTPSNPSGKWTNFTDGSCQRLIFDPDLPGAARYLLKCDSVPCCTEDQEGNHMEYQIPNVHPAILAPVTALGKETYTDAFGNKVTADVFQWKFGFATYAAYTTAGATKDAHAQLHRWNVSVQGTSFINDYKNFTEISEDALPAFSRQFRVPEVCGDRPPKCADLFAEGRLSDKSYRFVKQGKFQWN